MVSWTSIFGESGGHSDRQSRRDELGHLLPTRQSPIPSAIPAEEVTKVALRLRYQIETVIPCELEEQVVTRPHSTVITPAVVETAKQAGGDEYKSCVVYCLLICKKWFKRQAQLELWDADMHMVRAMACEIIAKRLIEGEEDMQYLLEHVLLKRFSIFIDGEESTASNAIEKAVDMHATVVIGSSGYQKCISYLWKGWLVQDDGDPNRFIPYHHKTNTNYWDHLEPDRMRVPRYQNAVQIAFTVIFLALYEGAINTINPTGDIDAVEGFLYIFTVGFIADEVSKVWKVGKYYIGFWNVFNTTLYVLLIISFIMRMVALGYPLHSDLREHFNELSYNFLAFTAPMFWLRLMLYLDTFRFFGAMLVIVKVMMKESIIFFALLAMVLVGFLQGFVGLDHNNRSEEKSTQMILASMANAIMTSPEFEGWHNIGYPFGITLYYLYTFVVMVVLLNILIALYGSAYEDITGNAIDEYLALFAGKCLQFVRAPDENVFIAPLNLIEVCCLIVPFEWWMPSHIYERLNNYIMGIIYSPVILITAAIECSQAHSVRENRKRGEEDDDTVEEWEQLDWKPEEEDEQWTEKVKKTSPNVAVDGTLAEVRELKKQMDEMKEMLKGITGGGGSNGETSGGKGETAGSEGFGLNG